MNTSLVGEQARIPHPLTRHLVLLLGCGRNLVEHYVLESEYRDEREVKPIAVAGGGLPVGDVVPLQSRLHRKADGSADLSLGKNGSVRGRLKHVLTVALFTTTCVQAPATPATGGRGPSVSCCSEPSEKAEDKLSGGQFWITLTLCIGIDC